MKKLLIAAVALAAFCPAVRADIVSSGIVGYNTTTLLANDYTMFGVQFEDVQGGGIKFGDLTGNFYGGPSQPEADNILVWENGVYTVYYYGVWSEPEWDNKWWGWDADANEEVDVSDKAIDAGTACWYLRRTDAPSTLTISGAIKTTPTTKTILADDYTMFSNPYPTAIKFKDLVIGEPHGGPAQTVADNILVWENGVYTVYYYGIWGEPEWDNKWWGWDADANAEVDVSDKAIDTGLACWYLRRTETATTLSFSSPLANQ